MQTRHIRTFRAIVEAGSIRGAARKLDLSQPAITKILREFETLLGAPLLLRSVHGVTLTAFGQALLPRVTLIDKEIERAQEEISQMLGQKNSTVAIGVSAVVAMLVSVRAIENLWRLHPQVNIKIMNEQFYHILSAIQQGQLDFAVGPLPDMSAGKRLVVEPLFHHRVIPVVRKDHPLRHATSLAEIQGCDWLVPNADNSYRTLLSQDFISNGLQPPRIAVECESFAALIELVRQSSLVAAVPATLLRLPLFADHAVAIPVKEKTFFTTIALVRDSAVQLTPYAALLARQFRVLTRQLVRLSSSEDIVDATAGD
jgi:LysR family transcriptional regulator of abg operon